VNKLDPGGNQSEEEEEEERRKRAGDVKKEGATPEGRLTKDLAFATPPLRAIVAYAIVEGVPVPVELPSGARSAIQFGVTPTGDGSGQLRGVPNEGINSTGYNASYSGSGGVKKVIEEASSATSLAKVIDDGQTIEVTTIHDQEVGSAEFEVSISVGEAGGMAFSEEFVDPIGTSISRTVIDRNGGDYQIRETAPVSMTQEAVDWVHDYIEERMK
jgi:hypothetical protein